MLGHEKGHQQLRAEKRVLARKLRESKTGTLENSHTRRENQTGWHIRDGQEVRASELPSLHESLAKEGFKGSFPLLESRFPDHHDGEKRIAINVWQGHHRLAATRNLNPQQFLPVEWYPD
jgi:hypothetical protein